MGPLDPGAHDICPA